MNIHENVYVESDEITNALKIIEQLDFDRQRKIALREGFVDEKQIDKAEMQYKQWLALKYLHPNETLIPTELIDAFWHAHILDTVKYQIDCLDLFGNYMHHIPNIKKSEYEVKKMKSAYLLTQDLWKRYYNENYHAEVLLCR